MNIAVAAEESAGIQTLRLLSKLNHRVVAVLTVPAASEKNRGASVAGVAANLGYPVWPAKQVKQPQLAQELKALDVDLLLNVHSLFIIHPEVLAAPKIGSFNLHPGPLPFLAGMNAPSWAIYLRRPQHAVTLHWMAAGIDTGGIAYQAWFDLMPDDTGLSVSAKCVRLGLPLIEQLLETAAQDPTAIPTLPQDLGQRQYFGFEVPHHGLLKWSLSAGELEAWIRASYFAPFPSPWGSPKARLGTEEIQLTKARNSNLLTAATPGTVGELTDGNLAVATGDQWLIVEQIHARGKLLPARAVLRSGQTLLDGSISA